MADLKKEKAWMEELLLDERFFEQVHENGNLDRLLSLSPHLLAMKDFEQKNPHHCYDLLYHSLHAVDHVDRALCLDDETYRLLRIAALWHDTGKVPAMTEVEKDGKVVRHFYGHAELSSKMADEFFEEMGYPEEERKLLSFYTGAHDGFMQVKVEEKALRKLMRKYAKNHPQQDVSAEMFLRLIPLMKADAMSQAEVVYDNEGNVINSREMKVKRLDEIADILKTMGAETFKIDDSNGERK